jgi:NADH-quinone oxidoreductase subunit I
MNTQKEIIVAPRLKKKNFFLFILISLKSLLVGLSSTLKYFFKSVFISTITMEYPENKHRIKISDRFRAKLVLVAKNLSSPHKCTGCKVCEKTCPNKSIYIISHKGISQKIELKHFIWRLDACTFCNACVIACPFDALKFKNNFEQAVYDRRLLIYNLNRYIGPPESYLKKNKKTMDKIMMPLQPYEKISLQEILGKC